MKISQAVGMGFLVMGAIGYFIKLSTFFTGLARRRAAKKKDPYEKHG